MNQTTRIAELEAEIKRLRALGRTKRDPINGVGGTIQRLREEREWSLCHLADQSGVPKGTISRIERGSRFEFWTLCCISSAFDMTPAALLLWHEEDSKKRGILPYEEISKQPTS